MPEEIVPFWLEPKVDGYMRWVTTSIARFDTDGDWPYDLDVKIIWNTNLTTYDGRNVALDRFGRRVFRCDANFARSWRSSFRYAIESNVFAHDCQSVRKRFYRLHLES